MFKLKSGNVFQKMNQMDRKKAYTLGAIVVVCFIALITLASFMGKADDTSFDGLTTRGYDLAQMPFVNDEAEQYLLAAKYPDMQNNNSTLLYSAQEKEERQEQDAAAEEETSGEDDLASGGEGGSGQSGYTSRGYSGRGYGGRGGSGEPTQVGQLGSASMGRASGSGVNSTFGAPRGDFSPYRSQEKGTEIPAQPLQNQNARKALYQFARGSQAAAGLKDGKGANAKRALMGSNIQGSEAFTDKGVDLSKASGLALDTNAPVTSADLSNLDKDVADAANRAKDQKNQDRQNIWDKLLEQALSGLVNLGMQSLGKLADQGIDSLFSSGGAQREVKGYVKDDLAGLMNLSDMSQATDLQKQQLAALGVKQEDMTGSFENWASKNILKQQPQSSSASFTASDAANGPEMQVGLTKDQRKDVLDELYDRAVPGRLKNSTFPMGDGVTAGVIRRAAYTDRMGNSSSTFDYSSFANNRKEEPSHSCGYGKTWKCETSGTGDGETQTCGCK